MNQINGKKVDASETEIRNIIKGLNTMASMRKTHSSLALAKYKEMPKFTKPNSYEEKLKYLRGYYEKDPLFGYLVDAVASHAVSQPDWEYVPTGLNDEFIEAQDGMSKSADIEELWRNWDKKLNFGIGNFLPSSSNVDKWIVKDLLLGGMCTLEWKWENMPLFEDGRKRNYMFPTVMINHPIESVKLRMDGDDWLNYREEILIKIPTQEVTGAEGSQVPTASKRTTDAAKADYRTLVPMLKNGKIGKTGSFCLKINWSPGSVVILDGASSVTLEGGLYPAPPFENLIPWLLQREALCSSDVTLLDGLINYMLVWVIGDRDLKTPLRPEKKDSAGAIIQKSDFTVLREMLEEYGAKKVMEVFLPWFIRPEFHTPPTDTIMSREKYTEATAELLYRFGIMSLASDKLAPMDAPGLETIIMQFRDPIESFWNMLSTVVGEHNKIQAPQRRYGLLPFSRDKILEAVLKQHGSGEVSTETVNRLIGLDPILERARVIKEVARKDREVYNKAVPVQFSQTVARGSKANLKAINQAAGSEEELSEDDQEDMQEEKIVSTTPRGRPKKQKNKPVPAPETPEDTD